MKNNLTTQQLNLEVAQLAFDIEKSKNQRKVFYVDVGSLPKTKAEDYVRSLMEQFNGKDGDYWLPRREGGRGTELITFEGPVSLDAVLKTAETLKNFIGSSIDTVGAANKSTRKTKTLV